MFLPPKSQKGKDFPAPSLQNPTPLPSMALSLSLSLTKPNRRSLSNPSFFHLFSSSSSSSTPPNDQDDPQFSSFLSDVRASLTNQQQTPLNQNLQNRSDSPPLRRLTFSNSNTNPGKVDSVEDIKKKLAEYRNRSPVPPPTDASNSAPRQQYNHVSFRELMDKQERGGGDSANSGSGNKIQFGPIRESLQRLRGNVAANNSGRNENRRNENGLPVSPIRFNLGNANPSVMGRTGGVSTPLFGKESGGDAIISTGFLRQYNHAELGERLRRLRPQEAKDGRTKLWFSIGELSERLRKLRELDEKEEQSRTSNIAFGKEIREGLLSAKISIDEKAMKKPMPRLNLFALGAPDFMLEPPQEHLVEKYFHPDNMTSSEKMKHELAKVRDEFKMSESDCGSARVQVAQLTTKIKHLSSVLHKKDKHSRKGLIGMVQQRKKLLKYLRRTDWDSYCFVLSKLGLRDNPDYKTRQ